MKKYHREVESALIIFIIGVLTFNGFGTSVAQGPSGDCPPKTSSPNNCWFCECWHEMLNYPGFDTMVGIGVSANYDMDWQPWASFGDAYWEFDSQAG